MSSERRQIIAQRLASDRLEKYFRATKDSTALEIFFRDVLPSATASMPNQLIWARKDADRLRQQADEIENRQIHNLVSDVVAEWPAEEIYSALNIVKAK